jgi:thymidylate synthase (FAD)
MKVELIDHMGSDLSVVNAARVSFDKQVQYSVDEYEEMNLPYIYADRPVVREADKKLIRYLAKHNHWTPFGHAFASFRIKAPIFVARQLGKHQVGLVWNEVSRRYVDSEPEFYVPDAWRKRAENVKQGSSDETIHNNEGFIAGYDELMSEVVEWYKDAVHFGICPEQARMVLPQSMYTEWVWSGSLAAFARVCKLRLDPHTQYETRLVASLIDEQMAILFPISWKALTDG